MSVSKWERLQNFALSNPTIAYNDELKKKFQTFGRAALKELIVELEGTGKVKNCNIDYNKGGIAVSGDFHLRGDFTQGGSFDFFFNLDGFSSGICYRKTQHQKDYTGGGNMWLRWQANIEVVVRHLIMMGDYHARREVGSARDGASLSEVSTL